MSGKELLLRTRMIWAITYAFIAGLNAGRGSWAGLVMIVIGGGAVVWWTSTLMHRAEEQFKRANRSHVAIEIKVDSDEAEQKLKQLRAEAEDLRSTLECVAETGAKLGTIQSVRGNA